jgi:HAE1 family hydrophobic/amphiphilic exporter-1
MSVDQVIASLRPKLAQVTGMRVHMNQRRSTCGSQGTAPSLFAQDTDTDELTRGTKTRGGTHDLPEVETSAAICRSEPAGFVTIDRDKIATLASTSIRWRRHSTTRRQSPGDANLRANNQYQVVLQVAPEFQTDPAALGLLYVRSNSGRLIPLDTVAKVKTDAGAFAVSHSGQLPAVTISFNLKPGVALGDAVDAITSTARNMLPSTIATRFQGTAQAFQDSLQGLGLILVMAIVVIYIVLGVLYESFTHPLTILSGLPAAGFGALLTLLLFKTELSLYAFVGVIMLVGLVKKNGIMMVDFAVETQRQNGRTQREAIREACLVRFRPIMMTTMAALVGTLPIALGLGAGAEARRPLGLAVVGGLLVSQLLTLYITRFTTYILRARAALTRRRKHAPDLAPAFHARTRQPDGLNDSLAHTGEIVRTDIARLFLGVTIATSLTACTPRPPGTRCRRWRQGPRTRRPGNATVGGNRERRADVDRTPGGSVRHAGLAGQAKVSSGWPASALCAVTRHE